MTLKMWWTKEKTTNNKIMEYHSMIDWVKF